MTPKLRFPELTAEWQVTNLLKLTKNGFSNGVFNDPTKVGSGYKLVNVKDMYVDTTIQDSDLTLVAVDEKDFLKNKVEYGDIFFTRSSLVKEGIAYSNIYLGHSDDITYDGHLIRMQPNSTVFPLFLKLLLATSTSRKQLVSRGTTSTMTTIGQREVSTVKVVLPKKSEQQKIAGFLTTVYERVEAQGKKVELLKKYKKSLMQKLFTQEIRFKNHAGNDYSSWGERTLGDIVTIKTGKKDVNQGNPNGQYPFFTCARDHTYSDEYSFEGEAVMIAGNGEVGLCTYYNGKFEAYQRTYVLQDFSVPANYVFIYLKEFFQTFAESQKQQGSMPYIKLSTLRDFLIPVQSVEEREKISKLLTLVDDKIRVEELKLIKSKVFKKVLMQKMFV